jgi:hypothetical protein
MSDLKLLVESIVTDLIEARFEADLKAAELAEVYRDHPALRQLNVPTLNISNVSVDLKVAFDDTTIEAATTASSAQEEAINEAATKLRSEVGDLGSVKRTVDDPRKKSALTRSLGNAVVRTAVANIAGQPDLRSAAVESEVRSVLTRNSVRLDEADSRKLRESIREFDKVVSSAPKLPARVPGVLIGKEALADVRPELVTNIRFDIDLSSARWTEADSGDGSIDVLTEE